MIFFGNLHFMVYRERLLNGLRLAMELVMMMVIMVMIMIMMMMMRESHAGGEFRSIQP